MSGATVTSGVSMVRCPDCNDVPVGTDKECAGYSDKPKIGPFHASRVYRGEQLADDVEWLRKRAEAWGVVPHIAMAMRQAADDMLRRYL